MSFNGMNYNSSQIQHEGIIIKTEPLENDKFNSTSSLTSTNLKCGNGQNDSSCVSELNNFQKTFSPCSIKEEPEESRDEDDGVHQVLVENLELKDEIDTAEHKPAGWELIGGSGSSSSNVGILFKDDLKLCDSVEENVVDPPLESRNRNEEQTQYNCSYCLYKTNNKSDYMFHYKHVHSRKDDMYKCQECSYKTRFTSNLTRHYSRMHPEKGKMYQCQECLYETNDISKFTQHYKLNKHLKETEVFKCGECDYKTKRKYNLTQHFKYKHLKEGGVHKCEECSFETRFKCNLSKHYRRKHSGEPKMYKCRFFECPYEAKIKSDLASHYKNRHSKAKEVYKCEECSLETRYKSNLDSHYKQRHAKETEVYKSEICSKKTKIKVIKHYKRIQIQEAEQLYKFEEWSFETRCKSDLTQHYQHKQSQEAEVYKCEECPFKTKCKTDLIEHYKYSIFH